MLINSTKEIQEFIAVGKDNEFSRIEPHLVAAESAYIKPILGAALLESIQSAYTWLTDPTTEDPEAEPINQELLTAQLRVLKPIQKALVYLAYWSGFQTLNATISDTGFKRTESATVKALFKYQEDDLRNNFKKNGFNALDEVLETLEENIAQFPNFKLTRNYTIRKSYFIADTNTMNSLIDVNKSRLTYLRLIPFFNLAEDFFIRPALGATLFDKIKSEMLKDTADQDTELIKIIPYIQKTVAFFSTAILMEESGADLMEKGLYFESSSAVSPSDRNVNPASSERIALLAKRNRQFAENYMDQLKSFLIANTLTFPEFVGSTGKFPRRDNTGKKSFWA